MFSLRICLLILSAQALLLLGGCAPKIFTVKDLDMMTAQERTAEILKNPVVDDLYVADISQFSIYPFQTEGEEGAQADPDAANNGSGSANENTAFGMLRVIKVNPESVLLVTEYSAWPKTPEGALDDLRGDLSNIAWHDGEEVVIRITALKQLLESGVIIEARRLPDDKARGVLTPPK